MKNALIIGAVVGCVAFLVWLGVSRNGDSRDKELLQRLQASEAQNAELAKQLQTRIVERDTLYVTQKVADRKAEGRYRTLRDSLLHLPHDTTQSDSTFAGIWADSLTRRLIFAADTALESCHGVIAFCEYRVSQRDTLLGIQARRLAAKDTTISILETRDRCHYGIAWGPCPEIVAFGGLNTGGLVAGLGVAIPLKRIRVRF